MEIDLLLTFDQPFHPKLVGLLITLCARGTNAWALSRIQDSKLNGRRIGIQSHDSAQGIDLTDHVAFPQPADGWIAGHLTECVEILAE